MIELCNSWLCILQYRAQFSKTWQFWSFANSQRMCARLTWVRALFRVQFLINVGFGGKLGWFCLLLILLVIYMIITDWKPRYKIFQAFETLQIKIRKESVDDQLITKNAPLGNTCDMGLGEELRNFMYEYKKKKEIAFSGFSALSKRLCSVRSVDRSSR